MITVVIWKKKAIYKKEQVGNGQEMVQSEKITSSQTKEWQKTKTSLNYLYQETYRKPSEQLFPNRQPLSYPNFTKNLKTYIRLK